MAEEVARPRGRDWLYVGVLALVLLTGLVHFGREMGQEPSAAPTSGRPSATAVLESSPTTPSAPTTSQPAPATEPAPTPAPSSAPSSAPSTESTSQTPTETPTGRAGTCWDGRATTSLRLCGLPEGARGLEWVFPSFATHRDTCRRARTTSPDYVVDESWVCFDEVRGQAVTVTYDQVEDPAQVASWMRRLVGGDEVVVLEGAHGGRMLIEDLDQRPARISSTYATYPYVVSVFAPTRSSARRAWDRLVVQRPSGTVIGTRAD